MSKVLIVYGSTGGNTEMVVEQVACILEEVGHCLELKRVERFDHANLIDEMKCADFVILASPTYGHGQLEPHMMPFLETLKDTDLKGVKYAVIGLGDPKYDSHYHIESTRILEEVMDSCGADRVHYALRISRSPVLQIDNLIPKWSEKFLEVLKNKN